MSTQLLIELASHGELLLISTVFSAIALSTIITHRTERMRSLRLIVGGLCVLNLLAAAMYYSQIRSAAITGLEIDAANTLIISALVFVNSLITSLESIVIDNASDRVARSQGIG